MLNVWTPVFLAALSLLAANPSSAQDRPREEYPGDVRVLSAVQEGSRAPLAAVPDQEAAESQNGEAACPPPRRGYVDGRAVGPASRSTRAAESGATPAKRRRSGRHVALEARSLPQGR